jgi:hypothetical protein
MKPSSKFKDYLSKTGNYRFRTRILSLVEEIEEGASWIVQSMDRRDYAEIDYLVGKIQAHSNLLYKTVLKKRAELSLKSPRKSRKFLPSLVEDMMKTMEIDIQDRFIRTRVRDKIRRDALIKKLLEDEEVQPQEEI